MQNVKKLSYTPVSRLIWGVFFQNKQHLDNRSISSDAVIASIICRADWLELLRLARLMQTLAYTNVSVGGWGGAGGGEKKCLQT